MDNAPWASWKFDLYWLCHLREKRKWVKTKIVIGNSSCGAKLSWSRSMQQWQSCFIDQILSKLKRGPNTLIFCVRVRVWQWQFRMFCQDKGTYRSVGMLSTSVSNRLFRDKSKVLQKPFWVKCSLLYCKQGIEVLLLDFFKRSGAVTLDKGIKHRNCANILQVFTVHPLNLTVGIAMSNLLLIEKVQNFNVF